MNLLEKKIEIEKLAAKRAKDPLKGFPSGYCQIESLHNGKYPTHLSVSPLSAAAKNFNSPIMLVGQDWASVESVKGFTDKVWKQGYDSHLATNKNLHRLLFDCFGLNFSDTYATNIFPFIKTGGMSSYIPTGPLHYSAEFYTLKEISIIKPKIVICLGKRTYEVLTKVITGKNGNWTKSLKERHMFCGAVIVASPHAGSLGVRNAGGFDALKLHWSKIKDLYDSLLLVRHTE